MQPDKAIKNSTPLDVCECNNFHAELDKFLFKCLYVHRTEWDFIGSFGKKEYMSDVDVAIKEEELNLEAAKEILSALGHEVKIYKGFNELSFGFPFKQQIVQVDLMFSKNLEWTKFIYYSPDLLGGESKYKGIYRNLLLSAILITDSRFELDDGSIFQMILRLNEGVFNVHKERIGNVSKITQEQFITDDPKRFIELLGLYGKCLTLEEVLQQVVFRKNSNEILERFYKFCQWSKLNTNFMGETKKMVDTEYEQMNLWIESILEEAARFNLREEVYESAQQNIQDDPSIQIIEAYQIAFEEWVK